LRRIAGKGEMTMGETLLIRVVAGALAVVVLGVIIYRRKSAA
jgi:hypothetical protein